MDETGAYAGLVRHFKKQGDEVVRNEPAELVLQEPFSITPNLIGHDTVVGPITHTVTRYWLGDGFFGQTFVGVPLMGMMNDDLGASCCTGIAGRFVRLDFFDWLYNEPQLKEFLTSLDHHDFITFSMSYDGVVGLQTGIPFWGLYAILEGVEGKLSEWLRKPHRIYELWSAALLVSRHPYPATVTGDMLGVDSGGAENVWFLGGSEFKGCVSTDRNEVAVVTGKSEKLNDAWWQIRKTAEKLDFEGIQYRTDLAKNVYERWAELREKALV